MKARIAGKHSTKYVVWITMPCVIILLRRGQESWESSPRDSRQGVQTVCRRTFHRSTLSRMSLLWPCHWIKRVRFRNFSGNYIMCSAGRASQLGFVIARKNFVIWNDFVTSLFRRVWAFSRMVPWQSLDGGAAKASLLKPSEFKPAENYMYNSPMCSAVFQTLSEIKRKHAFSLCFCPRAPRDSKRAPRIVAINEFCIHVALFTRVRRALLARYILLSNTRSRIEAWKREKGSQQRHFHLEPGLISRLCGLRKRRSQSFSGASFIMVLIHSLQVSCSSKFIYTFTLFVFGKLQLHTEFAGYTCGSLAPNSCQCTCSSIRNCNSKLNEYLWRHLWKYLSLKFPSWDI